MNDEIKTEDIIKSLRICNSDFGCGGCIFYENFGYFCPDKLGALSADRLERLSEKLNAARMENTLLKKHIEGKCTIAQYAEEAPAADQPDHFADTNKMAPDDERIMQQAIETYGVQAQCDVAIEEMAELTKAIVKIRRVADDYGKTQAALENLLEEIADVDIMIDQLKIMRGPKRVEEYRKKKLERLERRLNDDRG